MGKPTRLPNTELDEISAYQLRISELEAKLQEAEDTLYAIRSGDVDAVVVHGPNGQRVYTLESADKPYRVVIEQIQEGAVTLNKEGLILYCNQALASMFGTPVQRVIGSSIKDFVPKEELPILQKLLDEGGKSEIRFCSGGDTTIETSLTFSELPEEEGQILCGVVTDMTLHKLRMQELADKNKHLQLEIAEREKTEERLRQAQKMEAVGQLTGGLAHDFNNLLTVIVGNLQLVSTRVSGDAKLSKYIANAIGATERGAGLTQKLLAFSRRQTLKSEPIIANDLLVGAQMLAKQVIGVDIQLLLKPGENLWHCRTDANQLESAMLNLIINARDAMPQGGQLTVETANIVIDETKAAKIPDATPGRYVMVSIQDTGTGIPADVLPHVFEPFYTTKGVGKGSGLGLSMVYGFVSQSNGFVAIESQIDVGTAVQVYLPFAEAPYIGDRESPSEGSVSPSKSSAKILVVEDDPDILQVVTELIEDIGYSVVSAPQAADAFAVLEQEPDVDLIFTDVVMPGGISGIDLAKELKIKQPELPVLLTSGFTPQSVDNEPELKIIRKPYQRQDLADAIHDALECRYHFN